MKDLEKIAEATEAFGGRLTASESTATELRASLKTVQDQLVNMQEEHKTASEETKAAIFTAMESKIGEIQPKLAELERLTTTIAAASERIAKAGNEVGKEEDTFAAARAHHEFVQAAHAGDDGVYKAEDISDAMKAAYDRHAPGLFASMVHSDKMKLANARASIARDPIASAIFSASTAQLTASELGLINRDLAAMGYKAGMFSPVQQAPEFQLPQVFSEILRCFEDEQDVAGLVTIRRVTKRKYRQLRDVVDTGDIAWECEGECSPKGGDPIPLPEPLDGQVYGASSSTCIHMDDLEDRDMDWGKIITQRLAERMRRGTSRGILFGTGNGQPKGLLGSILKYQMKSAAAPAPNPSPLPAGAFIDWVNVEVAGSMLKSDLSDVALYGNRAGFTQLATTRNAFSDRSNAIRFGANGEMFVGSYRYRTTHWLPKGSNPTTVQNPLLPQATNFILGDLKKAYTLVIRKEAGISRHDPVNGGNCVTFLVRARMDGYVGCPNAAVELVSP